MINIIIDASVIIKWFLPFSNEQDVAQAISIKSLFEDTKCNIHIPSIAYYEISNILVTGVRLGNISYSDAQEILTLFYSYDFISYDIKASLHETFTIASEYDLSFYDASYVFFSHELGYPFITADKKLVRKVSAKFSNVTYIREFS